MADEQGYYGCKLPPGACGCPQEQRSRCSHSHWVKTVPEYDFEELDGMIEDREREH